MERHRIHDSLDKKTGLQGWKFDRSQGKLKSKHQARVSLQEWSVWDVPMDMTATAALGYCWMHLHVTIQNCPCIVASLTPDSRCWKRASAGFAHKGMGRGNAWLYQFQELHSVDSIKVDTGQPRKGQTPNARCLWRFTKVLY